MLGMGGGDCRGDGCGVLYRGIIPMGENMGPKIRADHLGHLVCSKKLFHSHSIIANTAQSITLAKDSSRVRG